MLKISSAVPRNLDRDRPKERGFISMRREIDIDLCSHSGDDSIELRTRRWTTRTRERDTQEMTSKCNQENSEQKAVVVRGVYATDVAHETEGKTERGRQQERNTVVNGGWIQKQIDGIDMRII